MISEHDKRRAGLAEHYARESIVLEAPGCFEGAAEALDIANEYLQTLYGRRIVADSASDVIAWVCRFCDAPAVEA
jgi:hypothetical protein